MLQGLYAAASGMEAQQTQLDAVSNDIANVSTPGYQGEILGFHDLLYTTAGPANATTQATGAGSAAEVFGRDLGEGSAQATGRSLDVALQGEGYLEVRRPDGTIGLTRNGALALNANRQLTNQLGMPVQPPITIPAGVPESEISFTSDGTVQAAGKPVGRLAIVTVPAPEQLLDSGDSTLSATAASGAIRPAVATTIQGGALEASNVDLSAEMGRMVDSQTSYNMDSRAIQMQDQMLQIANQIKP